MTSQQDQGNEDAESQFKVVEITPEEIAASKKSGKGEPAWNIHDRWPGSASQASIQKGKDSMTITIVIENEKPTA